MNIGNVFATAVVVVIGTMVLAGCTISLPESYSSRVVWQDDQSRIEVAFNDRDRQRIHEYYRNRTKRLPPGLAKKKRLPPGLKKQIARKGKLPPGLQGKGLPSELERDLTHLPQSFVRLKVGTDVVLMNEKTRIVADIIYDVGSAKFSLSGY